MTTIEPGSPRPRTPPPPPNRGQFSTGEEGSVSHRRRHLRYGERQVGCLRVRARDALFIGRAGERILPVGGAAESPLLPHTAPRPSDVHGHTADLRDTPKLGPQSLSEIALERAVLPGDGVRSDISARGLALSPLEAMATCAAVVGTDAHGNRDFCVDGVNCLTLEANAGAISAAIARLLADQGLRARLGRAGIETAQSTRGSGGSMRWRDSSSVWPLRDGWRLGASSRRRLYRLR
jgi:hypothetical protein